MRLRYTGQVPVSFMNMPHLGEVEPDAEFPVPDGSAEALLSRGDIELVEGGEPATEEPGPDAPSPARSRKATPSKPPEADQPAVTDPITTA